MRLAAIFAFFLVLAASLHLGASSHAATACDSRSKVATCASTSIVPDVGKEAAARRPGKRPVGPAGPVAAGGATGAATGEAQANGARSKVAGASPGRASPAAGQEKPVAPGDDGAAAVADAVKASKRKGIETEISQRERAIARLVEEMEAEVERLRKSLTYASNDQAGESRQQTLATEMQTASSRYRARIQLEREAIRKLALQLDEGGSITR